MADLLTHRPEQESELIDLAMLSNFVHQVVNPLNGVAGTLDNLQKGEIDESRRAQRLGAARAQVEQCITLLRNLAFLSKGFGRMDPAEGEAAVVPEIIIESAMFYQEDGATKSIGISLKDPVKNKVVAHRELVCQVLMYIFDKCIKYGE
jgi:K+-sensing histidine kinase KdpD